ncbi:MAG: PAS domain S-box protein [Cyanobacteria bacterium REEB67]|nr:PAS domain S-box protein [Cyanobacteria bacterium REEB67]
MKLSLTTKTTVIITLVAFVLIYIGGSILNLSVERLENSYLASKQFQLVELLDSVVLDLNRAEDKEHEYVLTGDPACYQGYNKAIGRIDGSLAKLRELLSDNKSYVMLLDELTESISFRRSCAVEVMKQRQSSGMEAALQRSKTFDETRLTSHVEWLARDVSHTINAALTNRFSKLNKDSITSMAGISTILITALLVLVLCIFFVNRYVQERTYAEKTLREAQQALLEREARMRAVVDTAPDGIVTIRSSGIVESANAVFGQMMGCDLTNIIERDIKVFIPGFLGEGSSALNDRRHGQGETRPVGAVRELMAVRDNGDKFPVEVSVSVVNLGKYDVYTGIVRDITERKEVEDRVKDFYSMVSHELRTPLASIRTALGIMENLAPDETLTKTRPVVRIAATEADRLMRLINDILDMRKVESGKLDLLMDVLDAGTIVRRAVDGVKGLAQEQHLIIETKVEPNLELYCDEDRTLQVLTNFLANAIKFSPSGGTILVECKGIGNRCRFAVTDHGPGVPKAQVHKLFGRFEQLRSTDGKQRPGSGLGLAIAKAIVEQHGGQIGVEQPDDGGSTFWFSLPLALDEDEDSDQDFEIDSEHLVAPVVGESSTIAAKTVASSAVLPAVDAAAKSTVSATALSAVAKGKSKKTKRGKRG